MPESTTSEAREIAAAQGGDETAFRRLVERYQATIGLQMSRFTRESQLRDELVQDVFVQAYFSLGSFQGRSPFEHWLRKIAVRVGYQFWTKRRRDQQQTHLSDEGWSQIRDVGLEPKTPTAAAELTERLLSLLEPADRLVLTLIYLDGCSMAEAAARAGWTTIGTKVRASRARQKLRDLMSQRGSDDRSNA